MRILIPFALLALVGCGQDRLVLTLEDFDRDGDIDGVDVQIAIDVSGVIEKVTPKGKRFTEPISIYLPQGEIDVSETIHVP